MKHTLAITLLVLSVCAPGMAQTAHKRLELPQSGGTSTTTTLWPVQTTTLQPWVILGDLPLTKISSGTAIVWSGSNPELDNVRLVFTSLALTVSRDDVKVGWLIPTCTTANLSRAPKLTAWIVGMQAYSSPQAKWLTALFKACEIQ